MINYYHVGEKLLPGCLAKGVCQGCHYDFKLPGIKKWQGIKQLDISFGSTFLLFSRESSQGPHSLQPGDIPGPQPLMTALCIITRKSRNAVSQQMGVSRCPGPPTYF